MSSSPSSSKLDSLIGENAGLLGFFVTLGLLLVSGDLYEHEGSLSLTFAVSSPTTCSLVTSRILGGDNIEGLGRGIGSLASEKLSSLSRTFRMLGGANSVGLVGGGCGSSSASLEFLGLMISCLLGAASMEGLARDFGASFSSLELTSRRLGARKPLILTPPRPVGAECNAARPFPFPNNSSGKSSYSSFALSVCSS